METGAAWPSTSTATVKSSTRPVIRNAAARRPSLYSSTNTGFFHEIPRRTGLARLAMRERLFEQALYPGVALDEVPAFLLFETLHGADARFPALASVDQALQSLEHMEAVDIESAIGDGDGVLLGGAKWRVDGRHAVGDGHRRARQHGKLQLIRDLHHAPRLPPVVGQMLVVKHRRRAPTLAEDVGDL